MPGRAGKSAKRRRWRMQRGDFEEVPRLAAKTVAGNRLARRWAREPRPYEKIAWAAVRGRAGRPGGRPLRMRYKGRGTAGRCGERIERRRWRMKRDERVAAVKILSVRRKAAPKFWAPQQGHRPLRRSRKFCEQRAGHLFSVCTQILLCACYNERMCFYSFP